jgi:repressor LexA
MFPTARRTSSRRDSSGSDGVTLGAAGAGLCSGTRVTKTAVNTASDSHEDFVPIRRPRPSDRSFRANDLWLANPNQPLIDARLATQQGAMMEVAYTPTQGQYLAFIYYYTKIHGVPPAESDFQRYFKTSPPAIHQLIVTLDKRGFIERTPGVGRSIRLRLSRDQLPDLL